MTDLISRQAAIDAICHNCIETELCNGVCDDTDRLRELPTIEPKRGKWEHHIGVGNVALMKCGECGFTYPELLGMMLFNFCPNCGARMSDEWEEPKINPCRGCEDYDGRGGCKSHGGCGAERSEE